MAKTTSYTSDYNKGLRYFKKGSSQSIKSIFTGLSTFWAISATCCPLILERGSKVWAFLQACLLGLVLASDINVWGGRGTGWKFVF